MIVVTLGTIPFPFERAIKWVHELIKTGLISESVFLQHGTSEVAALVDNPLVTTSTVVESYKLIELIDQARLVISHAGQGSTRLLADRGASFILVPRLAKYGEHIDNHQLLFAKSVEKLGVKYCTEFSELAEVVTNPPERFQQSLFKDPKLVDHLVKAYPGRVSSASSGVLQEPA